MIKFSLRNFFQKPKFVKHRIAVVGSHSSAPMVSNALRQMVRDFNSLDVSVFSKDEIFNEEAKGSLASGELYKSDCLEASSFMFGTDINQSHRRITEFSPATNSFLTDDGSIHQYQVLVLADDLHSDFGQVDGLEQSLKEFRSPVGSIDCVDLCFKQSKWQETSRLSNRVVYHAPTSDQPNDNNNGMANHAALRSNKFVKTESTIDMKMGVDMTFDSSNTLSKYMTDSVMSQNVGIHEDMKLKGIDQTNKSITQVNSSNEDVTLHFDNLIMQPKYKLKPEYEQFKNFDQQLQSTDFANVFAVGPMNKSVSSFYGNLYQSVICASNIDDYLYFAQPQLKYDNLLVQHSAFNRTISISRDGKEDKVKSLRKYLETQSEDFQNLIKGKKVNQISKLVFNPSPLDVQVNNELFITEAELKAKQKDDPEQRQEREAKWIIYNKLAKTGLNNQDGLDNGALMQVFNSNQGYNRAKFPEQASFPT